MPLIQTKSEPIQTHSNALSRVRTGHCNQSASTPPLQNQPGSLLPDQKSPTTSQKKPLPGRNHDSPEIMMEQVVSQYTGLWNSSLSRRPHPDQLKKMHTSKILSSTSSCPALQVPFTFALHDSYKNRHTPKATSRNKLQNQDSFGVTNPHTSTHSQEQLQTLESSTRSSTPQPIIHPPCDRVPAPVLACYKLRTAPSPPTCKVTLITLHHGQSALTHHNGSNSGSGHPESPWARASRTIQQCGENCARGAGLSRVEARHSSMAASNERGIQNASEQGVVASCPRGACVQAQGNRRKSGCARGRAGWLGRARGRGNGGCRERG